jgi:hypothetical protein
MSGMKRRMGVTQGAGQTEKACPSRFVLSVSSHRFLNHFKGKIDSSLLFLLLESESRGSARESDPVSHPSGSSVRPSVLASSGAITLTFSRGIASPVVRA